MVTAHREPAGPADGTGTALHPNMNASVPSRRPAGSPGSTGGQFAPSSLPEPHLAVGPPTNREPTASADCAVLREAFERLGTYPVTDPWGGVPDTNNYWSDGGLAEIVTTAVAALLRSPEPEIVERVAADTEWWTSDRLEIGVHFDVDELARAVRHHAAPGPPAALDLRAGP